MRRGIVPHLEPIEAWVVDETGWRNQSQHSAGVSRNCFGSVGKQTNCQVSVKGAVSDAGAQLRLAAVFTCRTIIRKIARDARGPECRKIRL